MDSIHRFFAVATTVSAIALAAACGSDSDEASTNGGGGAGGSTANGGTAGTAATGGSAGEGPTLPDTVPDISEATFTSPTTIDHHYLPMSVGIARIYLSKTDDGTETTIVEALDETREVMGVMARVSRDRVFADGELLEDTHDWFAQDDLGNVWYLGEEVDNYEYDDDGNVLSVDHEGAWEAGKDVADTGETAHPGYVMPASPTIGQAYHQEYYPGEAEDMGEILSLDAAVELADGSSFTTLEIMDTDLEGNEERKYYAKGFGLVLEVADDERGELVGFFDLTEASLPDFEEATFSNPTDIDNPFMTWTPGDSFKYLSETEDGTEEILIEVLSETRDVAGVTCAVVQDRVYLDGVLIEDTRDWFAQDDDGNVWYLGEEVDNYEYDEGTLIEVNNDGSWEAGMDIADVGVTAQPGIVMHAMPQPRTSFRQEFYEGEAEDMGFVVRDDAMVELSDGTVFENCLQTLDWAPNEGDALEFKFYAAGVGLVMETSLDGEEVVELSTD